ncbi:hypothetical protein [Bradyrhizobium diazoefficiens]|uniref:hypothetical protein n=1 Tax=Bradyrhizobium diazoefficiens TaxID=1355477 RepID=UPI0016047832|nr:hypothetical protein [Bradyrhizobium diazoefficiens]
MLRQFEQRLCLDTDKRHILKIETGFSISLDEENRSLLRHDRLQIGDRTACQKVNHITRAWRRFLEVCRLETGLVPYPFGDALRRVGIAREQPFDELDQIASLGFVGHRSRSAVAGK